MRSTIHWRIISTRAQTMLAVETDPEKRHKLSVIFEQAFRAHEMISDMMLFAHPPALARRNVSVRLLMAKLMQELSHRFAAVPQIETKVIVGVGIDRVDLDPTQYSVAIKSLIQNAIESLESPPNFSHQSRHLIEVRIGRTNSSEVQVSVSDSGIPISPTVVNHQFDPFYSGREAGRGLGFGLSKAWTIAKLHGGTLRYSCENGNCFEFTIR